MRSPTPLSPHARRGEWAGADTPSPSLQNPRDERADVRLPRDGGGVGGPPIGLGPGRPQSCRGSGCASGVGQKASPYSVAGPSNDLCGGKTEACSRCRSTNSGNDS